MLKMACCSYGRRQFVRQTFLKKAASLFKKKMISFYHGRCSAPPPYNQYRVYLERSLCTRYLGSNTPFDVLMHSSPPCLPV